jgi:hypothetical protein
VTVKFLDWKGCALVQYEVMRRDLQPFDCGLGCWDQKSNTIQQYDYVGISIPSRFTCSSPLKIQLRDILSYAKLYIDKPELHSNHMSIVVRDECNRSRGIVVEDPLGYKFIEFQQLLRRVKVHIENGCFAYCGVIADTINEKMVQVEVGYCSDWKTWQWTRTHFEHPTVPDSSIQIVCVQDFIFVSYDRETWFEYGVHSRVWERVPTCYIPRIWERVTPPYIPGVPFSSNGEFLLVYCEMNSTTEERKCIIYA